MIAPSTKYLIVSIAVAVGLSVAFFASAIPPYAKDVLVKASGDAVYYYAQDGKRYVFPNQQTYNSWFTDFSDIVEISDEDLASMPLGGNVRYRPGIRMIKLQTDPKVYAVSKNGVLRWVTTEEVAIGIYGATWNTMVDDVSDAFFFNYTVGSPISDTSDFTPADEADLATTINENRGLIAGQAPRQSDTTAYRRDIASEPTIIVSQNNSDADLEQQWREFAFGHINQLRAENGNPGDLVMNSLLNDIAMTHSKDMSFNIKDMSHDGSLGETATERIKEGKVPDHENPGQFVYLPFPDGIGWSGENVGRRYVSGFNGDVEAAIVHQHEWFMDEPMDQGHNHRTTMLSSLAPFSEVGIGIYLDDEGIVWITEDFISRL